jgi:hypothetical protein
MKTVLFLTAAVMMVSVSASASCKGGQYVSTCSQISTLMNGKALSARIAHSDRFKLAQVALTNSPAHTLADMASCPVDLLQLNNGQEYSCKTGQYSYDFLNMFPDENSMDPYLVGAKGLVKRSSESVFAQSEYGILVKDLQSGEKSVLGCRRIIECPSNQ